jgi:hypothetical protein
LVWLIPGPRFWPMRSRMTVTVLREIVGVAHIVRKLHPRCCWTSTSVDKRRTEGTWRQNDVTKNRIGAILSSPNVGTRG